MGWVMRNGVFEHDGCLTPSRICGGEYLYELGQPTVARYFCGKEEIVSYVNSSKYETETPLEAAERLLKEAQENLLKVRQNARFGTEPSGGSILKFEKWYTRSGGIREKYTYAALRVGQLWYLTGSDRSMHASMTWNELKKFIGDGKSWAPRNYELLPSA